MIIYQNNFKYIAYQWLSSVRIKNKIPTYIKYEHIIINHLIPAFGNYEMIQIDTLKINDFIMEKSQNGRINLLGGLSPKSVKDILCVLKQIIKYAKSLDIEINSNLSITEPRVLKKDVSILSKENQKILELYLYNNINLLNLGILLVLYTGLRLGEICALTKKDIDLTNNIIKISKTMQRIKNPNKQAESKTIILIDTPKSISSIRSIPIPAFLVPTMQELLSGLSPDSYILTGFENKFIEPRNYENIFKRILKECQLENIHFHALRHTFATRAVEANFDIKTLSELLGHSNVSITLNKYVHSSMELKKKNMDKLNPLCMR
mgnify:CR=1 FL=1